MKESKIDEILYQMYKRVYAISTPVGDFDKLMEEAEINDEGKKVIPFWDYTIDEKECKQVIEEIFKEYKVKDYYRQRFINTFMLGACPEFKR
jgi:hypothetical protein